MTRFTTPAPLPAPHRCAFPPPSRVWERTSSGLWASRPWYPGERERYAASVLGQ